MPFTKAPETSTFKTQRFPVVGTPLQRNGAYVGSLPDQRFLNCYPEKINSETLKTNSFYLRKRPGLISQFITNVAEGRGIIYEDSTQKTFGVTGNIVWVWDGTTLTNIGTLATSTGAVGWTVHLTTGIDVALLDGVNGYLINPNTNVFTQITDVNFPSPHVPDPVSMDGYLFVAKAGTADIYNSNLNVPTVWTPGDFITAEMYPDFIVALSKNNNYIYAVGTGSVEFFYDAGIATGSPLQRNDSAVLQFGTPAPGSVTQTEKEVIMIGSTQNGGRTIWLIEGFKATEIALEPVKMSLDAEGAAISTCNCYCIRTAGHKFYVLRLEQSKRTWVYDFEEKLWHEWSGYADDGSTPALFRGAFCSDSTIGHPFMQDTSNGRIYSMSEDVYQDNGVQILVQMTTEKQDFDNMNRKDYYRFVLFGDWPNNVTTSNITLDWTDDDYRTYQGNRTINLCQALPVTRRLGKSRRRAFRLTYTDNQPLRLEGFEVDVNIGGT